jgi:hypothetical protein
MQKVQNIDVAPELIVCCGDTLSHLPDEETIKTFIKNIADKLVAGGRFVVSFRDYSTELSGNSRFIPVNSDDSKILTCVLDYETDHVRVTDLLHIKNGNNWEQHISSYYKFRLNSKMVQKFILDTQLQIDHISSNKGMVYMLSTKL